MTPFYTITKERTFQLDMEILRCQSLFIATPCYGGNTTTIYNASTATFMELSKRNGMRVEQGYVWNESDVARARNRLMASWLRSGCRWMLFWDADEEVTDPHQIWLMMATNLPVVAAPVPTKSIQPRYNVNFPDGERVWLNGCVKVDTVGTGFMLIDRVVAETMIREGVADKLVGKHAQVPERDEPYYHAFFEPSYPDGDWLTEDFTFCRKAQQAGFGVWLWPYAKVNHMGAHVFTGDENVVRAMCWGVNSAEVSGGAKPRSLH